MSVQKEKLAKLLGSGVQQKAAADACGFSESYVSQLLNDDPQFAAEVAELKATRLTGAVTIDAKLDALELQVLEKLERVIPGTYKMQELLNAFTRINGAKRRGAGAASQEGAQGPIVQISIPVFMQQAYNITLDAQNKVVQIGETTMVPATVTTVRRLAQERQALNGSPVNLIGNADF